jgi:ATP-dependent DNA helicase RecG
VGGLDSPVSILRGVSRSTETKLRRLGICTVRDLLFHFPRVHRDYSEVRPIAALTYGEEQTIIGRVWSVGSTTIGTRKATEAIVGDDSGAVRVIWWGQPWMEQRLRRGQMVAMSGKVKSFRGRLQVENPEIEQLDDRSLHTRRLVPVYPSTSGINQRQHREWARQALEMFAEKLEETLPEGLRRRLGLPGVAEAMRQIHFPDSKEQADQARRRFAFEELLYIEIGVVRRRKEWQASGLAPVLEMPQAALSGFIESLPFELTAAQRRAIDTVLADIGRPAPMTRLLEGDVGSGKTVVATAALLAAVTGGYQGAIMAPTEILAEQHFQTFNRLLHPGEGDADDALWFRETAPGYVVLRPPYMDRPLRVALLTGSLRNSEKAAVHGAITRGEVDIVAGTHALLQEDVSFLRLGLVVVDEQHRFGVVQRAALREKGRNPHVLVMTATPIPRTLALTVYGDLDITVLNEMPPGRPPVKTYRVRPEQRSQAYEFLRKKVREGRQAYIICPLVEESEAVAAKAAVQEYERLSTHVFPDLRLGLLHGRMTPAEKDATMRAFRDGALDVLVSTAVVEVGVDVPNATVMLVEGADRFGLSQLHQFRGRVRRSTEQAYCFLLSESPSAEAMERLQIMETVDDGFRLAEEDLRIRGPGEYFGTRQSGMPDLRVASLTDVELIELARIEATRVLDEDPELLRPEHRAVRERVDALWERLSAEVS